MNAKEYAAITPEEKIVQVIGMAGTRWGYWEHLATLRKRPGPDLARRLVAASQMVTPENPMTLDALLIPREVMRRARESAAKSKPAVA